jgi:hypothetical protein
LFPPRVFDIFEATGVEMMMMGRMEVMGMTDVREGGIVDHSVLMVGGSGMMSLVSGLLLLVVLGLLVEYLWLIIIMVIIVIRVRRF